ncbi:hypothetical protein B0H13DRAFT_1867629 [Mycena leptocephala]|nr:hypothetical protein B0H13DRAFT_1867629 [Mycena leptocephala]
MTFVGLRRVSFHRSSVTCISETDSNKAGFSVGLKLKAGLDLYQRSLGIIFLAKVVRLCGSAGSRPTQSLSQPVWVSPIILPINYDIPAELTASPNRHPYIPTSRNSTRIYPAELNNSPSSPISMASVLDNSVNARYPLPFKLSPSPPPCDHTLIYYPANLILILFVPFELLASLGREMAKGQIHKKLKTQRKTRQARQDRQYNLRSAARHVHTSAFLACEELVLYHLLEARTLASLIALSHTSVFFRTLVKTLFRIRLIAAVDPFVGHDNTAKFFEVLKSTESAIAGSTIARILAPPIDDIEDWMPNNLNIYPPLGCTAPWEQFFERIQLPIRSFQPGVARPYAAVTRSHVEYESRSKGRAITLSERIDACVLTPATAAVTTLGMCVATCSTLAVLYPQLVNQRRALEGWNEPSIQKCIDMEERGFRRSISTMSWSDSCGWNCPAIWRRIQGLRGVGIFCWGGSTNDMMENGTIGVPYTEVTPIKWRLGDTCKNVHCPWWKASRYFQSRSWVFGVGIWTTSQNRNFMFAAT